MGQGSPAVDFFCRTADAGVELLKECCFSTALIVAVFLGT